MAAGWRIAFLAYSDKATTPPTETEAGVNTLDPVGLAQSEIRAAKREADLVIVMVHWGRENYTTPTTRQREIARRMVQMGADMVIGAHPHVLQPVVAYRGATIAYSLGNFVFDNHIYAQQWTAALWIEVSPDGTQSRSTYPCRIVACQPRLY